MARPLRIELAGGRYHVAARGNERRNIYRDNRDRAHFIGLLAELPDRFGVRVHAYALMPNHYHLLVETPEPNLSRTGQWLNVSYSVWFNRRHGRSGHLFQGRFGAVLIQDDLSFQAVGRYVHLNPVRMMRFGLDKQQRMVDQQGLSPAPNAKVVAERLRVLRDWRWSSYPAYAGYVSAPTWLTQDVLLGLSGGSSVEERMTNLRTYTEGAVRQGLPESPWEGLIGGVVMGTVAFARKVSERIRLNRREQPGVKDLVTHAGWEQIVQAVETVKGEGWDKFRDRHGDWGRDAVLWLGRRIGRLRLQQLAELAGGIDYTTAGAAVSRFSRRLSQESDLRQTLRRIEVQLSNVEM